MITYQVEAVRDCIMDIQPLLVQHFTEVETNTDIKKLDPDYEQYINMERAGILRIVTARDAGVLIGYLTTMVVPHLHCKECVTALNDMLYVHPHYRGGTTAYRLLQYAINDLKSKADIMIINMKTQHPFRELLTKLGFEHIEETWEKSI